MCQAGDVAGLERLLAESEGKLDVNARDESDVTPLHWAAINAHVGTCQ
jgi:palmitoyltransferase